VVLGVYVGLSFLSSPRGFLGTDTGGKVATLRVMADRRAFDPDLGYWAERWDPTGALHPIGYTSHTSAGGRGRWVNVTTLPALWVGWLLFGMGGYRAALLVPMAGSLAASFAGLGLLRRLGVSSDAWAWAGFFVLALASPLTVYALDFWEHSLGVALVAWAVVLLVDSLASERPVWWRPVAAGLLFGAAATMRTESLVYVALAGLTWVSFPFWSRSGADGAPARDRIGRTLLGGMLLLAGATVPLVANELVERRVVGSTIRAARIAGTVVGIGSEPTDRAREALLTLFGLAGNDAGIALGLAATVLLVLAALRTRRDPGLAIAATLGAGAMLVVRLLQSGLGFVPGLSPAWVLPARAFVNGEPDMRALAVTIARRFVLAVAVGAIPLVLATQFRGGAAPQWAGRYLLPSGFLLTVAGWAALARADHRRLAAVTAALAAATTAFGVAWLAVRSHDVDHAIAALQRRTEPVLVSGVYHLAREGGATYGDKRWLTLDPTRPPQEAGAPAAARVLHAADVTTFASVDEMSTRRRRFEGFHSTTTSTIRLFDGVDLRVTHWEADA
jgi:hypothetical protein